MGPKLCKHSLRIESMTLHHTIVYNWYIFSQETHIKEVLYISASFFFNFEVDAQIYHLEYSIYIWHWCVVMLHFLSVMHITYL